jgi:Peptidase A4 family
LIRVHISRLLAAAAALGASSAVSVGGFATASAATVKARQSNPTRASVSSNWAGYVASGSAALTVEPTTFSSVSATWVQPKADCGSKSSPGATSSAFWVGLGGDSNSNALEQTGTEANCGSGGARYFAWYELVPAGSAELSLNVTPGDTVSASVSVSGKRVSILMRNLSQGTSFARTLTMAAPDTSSAEWIAEAPSMCASSAQCRQQSLTDFGTIRFSNARAQSSGHTGSISDSSWTATPIKLRAAIGPGGPFGGRFAHEQNGAAAQPSTLRQSGSAFSVTWHRFSSPGSSGGYSL